MAHSGNFNLSLATVNIAGKEDNYYMSVFALTPKEVSAHSESPVKSEFPFQPQLEPYMIYLPFVIFFVLFIAAFGIQMMDKIWNIKKVIMSLVIAFCLAGTPYAIGSLTGGIHFRPKAGPDEVPRNVRIVKISDQEVSIKWTTDKENIGAVRFGISPLTEETSRIIYGDDGKKTYSHTVNISNVKKSIPYELEIFSGVTWYDDNGHPLQFSP